MSWCLFGSVLANAAFDGGFGGVLVGYPHGPRCIDQPVAKGGSSNSYTHMIHGAGIFTYMWVIFGVNVGKYSIHGLVSLLRIGLSYFLGG